jgi:endonuclease/exonuclease/phosphatase family metal-dependent hydrolase
MRASLLALFLCAGCGSQLATVDDGVDDVEVSEGALGAVPPGTAIRITRTVWLRANPAANAQTLLRLVAGDTGIVIGNGRVTSTGFQKVLVRGTRGWVPDSRLALATLPGQRLDAGSVPDAGDLADAGAAPDAGWVDDAGVGPEALPPPADAGAVVRIIAANLTSGPSQAYEPSGSRILTALRGDIIALQEFNVGDNAPSTLRGWVTSTFGAEYQFVRGTGVSTRCATCAIPNGIVTRFPILASGEWDDVTTTDREFTWARLDVPGERHLVVVSVHLRTASEDLRDTQARALAEFIRRDVDPADELVVAGDFNVDRTAEPCLSTLAPLVTISGPSGGPVDGRGSGMTNGPRSKPYDQVAVDSRLRAREVPVVIGASAFPTGFVADTRVHAPLTDLAPARFEDSAALNMQHMAVVRAFSY